MWRLCGIPNPTTNGHWQKGGMMDDGFSYIPACMLKLPPELYHLWGAIRSTMKGGLEVSNQTLCELTGKSERQVTRNLASLAKCGAIRMEAKPGQRRKIVCTPETFQVEKLENQPEPKEEETTQTKQTKAEETDMHDIDIEPPALKIYERAQAG